MILFFIFSLNNMNENGYVNVKKVIVRIVNSMVTFNQWFGFSSNHWYDYKFSTKW